MENTLPVWIIPTLTLIGGIIIGVILTRLLQSTLPQSPQKQLHDLQERFDSYQSEVINNFSTTATMVSELHKSHQNMQEHMLHSAERLALDEQSRERLLACLTEISPHERIGSQPAEQADSESTPTPVEPPKDYAPPSDDESEAESEPVKPSKKPVEIETAEPPKDYAPDDSADEGATQNKATDSTSTSKK